MYTSIKALIQTCMHSEISDTFGPRIFDYLFCYNIEVIIIIIIIVWAFNHSSTSLL